MSRPAFYLPLADWGDVIRLRGEEARHASVLRLKPGSEAIILDGEGETGLYRVEEAGRKEIRMRLLERWSEPRPESRPIIAIALSKAARRGFFLEKAAELGAWAVWLWQAERSQGEITDKLVEACRLRLEAGAKQCHNPWFPKMERVGRADKLAAKAEGIARKILPWEEKAGEPVIDPALPGQSGDTIYAIGPEGGLAAWEADCLIKAGFAPVSLGKRVLRCETAATFCLCLHLWASSLKAENG